MIIPYNHCGSRAPFGEFITLKNDATQPNLLRKKLE